MNTNGVLSFDAPVPDYSPDPFPISNSTLIAPFWADIDTNGTGQISYRRTNDSDLLEQVKQEIQKDFEDSRSFVPTTLLIATWDNVGYFVNGTDKVC